MPNRSCFYPLPFVREGPSGSWLQLRLGLLGLRDGQATPVFLTGLWSARVAEINDVDIHLFPDCSLIGQPPVGALGGSAPKQWPQDWKALEGEGVVPMLNVKCSLWQNAGD